MRFVASAWATFAFALVPLGLHLIRHPGALSSRLGDTTFVEDGMSVRGIIVQGLDNYYGYFNLPHWALVGDPNGRHHVSGAGSLSLAVAVLAVCSVVMLLRRSRIEGFWRFVLAMTLLAPVPAALTDDEFHALRSIPLVVGLLVLSIPALEALDHALRERRSWARPAAVLLAAVWLAGAVQFGSVYLGRGPDRTADFQAAVPRLLGRATATGERLFIAPGDLVALAQARWYGDRTRLEADRIVALPADARPPRGALVLGAGDGCTFPCTVLTAADDFWLARAS
jgi:hypothetical protein